MVISLVAFTLRNFMDNLARIVCTQHQLPLGKHYITYEWEGKKHWPVIISDRYLNIYDLPWPLELIDRDWVSSYTGVYMRTDTKFPFWWFTKIRVSIGKLIRPIYYRLILTAMVWGLAYVPNYEAPSWKHLGKKK